ncbi:galacturonosyltransferase 7 [Artemisia annua]|uniref:Hexosyltransferase n=1 Tax=Artemisia annua TaxID=35608 RepID=A0A2U1Q0W4_ARTAN|nr:galacturonosyltransferase 7 [Artemisia annua]
MGGKVIAALEFCAVKLGAIKTKRLNIIDLGQWRKRDITRSYQSLVKQRLSEKKTTLGATMLTFQGLLVALDDTWVLSGLGHNYGISNEAINKAAVLHFNGNMKTWLELGISSYKSHWRKFLNNDDHFLADCNIIFGDICTFLFLGLVSRLNNKAWMSLVRRALINMGGKVIAALEFCAVKLGAIKTKRLNIIDLGQWRKRDITRSYQSLVKQRLIEKTTLGATMLTFQGLLVALDDTWVLSGLGHNYGISNEAINKAVVLHFNGNMKTWLELGISSNKSHWRKFLNNDNHFLTDCNVNP